MQQVVDVVAKELLAFTIIPSRSASPDIREKGQERYTWNVNSVLSAEAMASKMRSLPSLAFSGPICLQETKWDSNGPGEAKSKYPTIQLVSSPAIVTDKGGLSGGVAVVFASGIQPYILKKSCLAIV